MASKMYDPSDPDDAIEMYRYYKDEAVIGEVVYQFMVHYLKNDGHVPAPIEHALKEREREVKNSTCRMQYEQEGKA